MTTNVNPQAVLAIDDARRVLCHLLAVGMRDGAFRFQLRFLRHGDSQGEVWIYAHQTREWQKRDDLAFPSELVPSLLNQMEMVSTREYADDWICRRVEHSDRTDFKLMFRRKSVESQLTGDLESFLNGSLFHGHHDSGKDARRRIRFQGR